MKELFLRQAQTRLRTHGQTRYTLSIPLYISLDLFVCVHVRLYLSLPPSLSLCKLCQTY